MTDDVFNILYSYGPTIIMFTLSLFILQKEKYSTLHIITSSLYLWMLVYFVHRSIHYLPIDTCIYYINLHLRLHHEKKGYISRFIELSIETIQQVIWFIVYAIFQYILDIQIVSNTALLFMAILYTSTHTINYSLLGSNVTKSYKHESHHKNPNVNYSPDFMDHIFGTNSDSTLENMSHTIPNILCSFVLVYFLKSLYPNWF
jgi:hypothetical protein